MSEIEKYSRKVAKDDSITKEELTDNKIEAASGGAMDEQTKAVARKINKLQKLNANKSDLGKRKRSILDALALSGEGDDDNLDDEEDELL